ncbi:hypothetical protein ACQCSU_14335 [Pseudarthrobacter sp. O4]
MRTTSTTGQPGAGALDIARGLPARAAAWPAVTDSCPEDCHYCSGPETD